MRTEIENVWNIQVRNSMSIVIFLKLFFPLFLNQIKLIKGVFTMINIYVLWGANELIRFWGHVVKDERSQGSLYMQK